MVLYGIDIQPLVHELLGYFALALALMAVELARRLLGWMRIKVSDARFAKLQVAAEKVMQLAGVRLEDRIRAIGPAGWDDPVVKADAVELSLNMIAEKFPEAVKLSGLDPEVLADQMKLRDMMERMLPDVFARLAASPATPPSEQPVAAVVVPGTNPGGV